ncbi:nuclear receptor coactivator 5 isoform X2 [Denticeps clupeoides]|uniref:nuclear receptor coactivator 5 isoform X2 n=1 Tax=Denticeps clupeoides TaxID=299321 RepID=UPI0010A2CC38|nr:nuclear receptor coactivator 5 isoform X2 [Denticeps clupeoides]
MTSHRQSVSSVKVKEDVSAMSRRRSRSGTPPNHGTNSNHPYHLERRIFVGNLPTTLMDKKELEDLFSPYGKINDINMAAERRQNKSQSRPSPPRRTPYGGYGESRDGRPRSRSPVRSRESRDHREPGREPRPGPGPARDHDPRDPASERYRGSEGREKDRGDPSYRNEGYDRYYRMEDYYRKKEPYREPYREAWSGRRESEDERASEGERRRNELYRQYYEELQRRYDSERPVDCSVIVVNKQQKEYAETVGRKVRDVGMVVDLIFLNTEVSLTQALEDVSRARTPFAIIITQQHQVHRSCTVNILFGTPQEHRNMPMQDAMVLVAQNYNIYKVEHRDKEREEIARKAAKMADDVLMRELDREPHPASLLSTITLLSEGRFLTPEELDRLIEYLRDKRGRFLQGGGDLHAGSHTAAAPVTHEAPAQPVSAMAHQPALSAPPSATLAPPSNHQQELQAKILSLFNSGVGATASVSSTLLTPQPQSYGGAMGVQPSPVPLSTPAVPKMVQSVSPTVIGARPAMAPAAPLGYGAPASRMAVPQGVPRPLVPGTGINFDNPSVQKALDTLIQSGPSINHLVNSGSLGAAGPRPSQAMGQAQPMSHYARPY